MSATSAFFPAPDCGTFTNSFATPAAARNRRNSPPPLLRGDPSAAISKAALDGSSPLCVQAMDLFVSFYGAEAGNLALKMLATRAVYIGGGIAPKIIRKLQEPRFLDAFSEQRPPETADATDSDPRDHERLHRAIRLSPLRRRPLRPAPPVVGLSNQRRSPRI